MGSSVCTLSLCCITYVYIFMCIYFLIYQMVHNFKKSRYFSEHFPILIKSFHSLRVSCGRRTHSVLAKLFLCLLSIYLFLYFLLQVLKHNKNNVEVFSHDLNVLFPCSLMFHVLVQNSVCRSTGFCLGGQADM